MHYSASPKWFFYIVVFVLICMFALNYAELPIETKVLFYILALISVLLGYRVCSSSFAHEQKTTNYLYWLAFGTIGIISARNEALLILLNLYPGNFEKASEWIKRYDSFYIDYIALFSTIAIVALHHLRPSALNPLGYSPDHIEKDKNYLNRKRIFLEQHKEHVKGLDYQLGWHRTHFVPLRAEIDILRDNKPRIKVVDLVEALSNNTEANIFVVLGVPGAGKSVALRKCCVDLLERADTSGRFPINVNLKEWKPERAWTATSPPTSEEFSEFVSYSIRQSLPDWSRNFYDESFKELIETGDVFFMFDSFDELPGILDADDNSELLRSVSSTISNFIRAHPNSRGVIASRYFRKPQLGQREHATLEVRPFSEVQVAEAIKLGLGGPLGKAFEKEIFTQKLALLPAARNPFTLSLIIAFWQNHQKLPETQSELYKDYIRTCFDNAQKNIERANLDKECLDNQLSAIAWRMFSSADSGLEILIEDLEADPEINDASKLVDVLVNARLLRKTPIDQKVSFVHRRFNEYFLISRWVSRQEKPPLEAIPSDSRYRDALVLYAEVASYSKAKEIANFCWTYLEQLTTSSPKSSNDIRKLMKSVYSLRFLAEAFRSRPRSCRQLSHRIT